MNKKLYRVKVILLVMAENEADACMAATNAKFDIFECSARKADHLEPGWEDAIPHNSEDSRTCAEILAEPQNMIFRTSSVLTEVQQFQSV
jgi:hypothetical protein